MKIINNVMKIRILCLFLLSSTMSVFAQKYTDANSRLHAVLPINYETPYGKPKADKVKASLDKVYSYLNETSPAVLIDKETKKEITNLKKVDENDIIKPVDFRLISYEWGVTYAGMLLATENTGDERFAAYSNERINFLAELYTAYQEFEKKHPDTKHVMSRTIHPKTLDDCGALCAAFIKSKIDGNKTNLDPMIDNFINHISNEQFRFPDGTLARNSPFPNTLWLDDLFMSVPALAQMGKYTGDTKYFDDAIKQVLQFSERMFNEENGLYMHGWVQGMDQHPQFHWARANGWAVMTMVELLDVLPEGYKGRDQVLNQLKKHIFGLAKYQSSKGLWHQLIDKNDSYLETSATAIYAYAIAKAINKGWIDSKVYEPMLWLAWNGIETQITDEGQIKNTCVGTGMGFDPAFYYYRPVSVYAAHGYGPVMLAGAEIYKLLKNTETK